jgi:uncharacterized repeat protein (TIGR03803 family)
MPNECSYGKLKTLNPLRRWKLACAIFLFCAAAAIAAPAQTFTTLVNFDATDGDQPLSPLVQGTDGNFYGTTVAGGANNNGAVFKITPGGTLTTLYSYCAQPNCADGASPTTGLIQADDGDFYGTTQEGGAGGTNCPEDGGCGTVFKISPDGTLTTLHSFSGGPADGWYPEGALVQGTYGDFYGTTLGGGANGGGTVFRMSPAGTFTLLYSFCALENCADGDSPEAGLIQADNGDFYGTTGSGGGTTVQCPATGGCGTVFKMGPDGALATIHRFHGTDGNFSLAALLQGTDGNLYGTTFFMGGRNCSDCGPAFKITPTGTFTLLYKFCTPKNCPDGAGSFGLVQGTDGNLYGASAGGGAGSLGSVFQLTPAGTLTTLYSLSPPDGIYPNAPMIQGTDGTFYGTTGTGGVQKVGCPPQGCGTVYSIAVGLGPFVTARPGSRIVGESVAILGNNLTGTTSVSFNGAAAAFTASATEITATVPAGATTGQIKVTTPTGVLTSNQNFRVRPQIFSFSPTSGPPGSKVTITGESFTQAGAVTLAYKYPMTYTIDSDTQITATIPAGATTGEISVRSPGGVAHTTAKFTVTQ